MWSFYTCYYYSTLLVNFREKKNIYQVPSINRACGHRNFTYEAGGEIKLWYRAVPGIKYFVASNQCIYILVLLL